MDEYLVPTDFGEDEFIEKKSRFIGRVWPVETEEEALEKARDELTIYIAVPTLENVPVDFMESLMNLACHLKDEGVNFKLKIESGTLVYFARENLARYAIANRFSHVLWLDSDMVFNEQIVEDLQFCGGDIVTGIAHSRRPPFSSCLFTQIYPGVEKWKGEYPRQAFKVAACGMACCLMKTVNILGDHCTNLSFCLQFRQLFVGVIGNCIRIDHFVLVKTIKFLGIGTVEAVTDDGFRRICVLHMFSLWQRLLVWCCFVF